MRRVLPPDLRFDALAQILAAQGWQRETVPGLRPPLRANEPEQARFIKADKHLIYSFNPVIDLRLLDGDLDQTMPCVANPDIARWLLCDDPRIAARGCLAAAELNLTHLRASVVRAAGALPEALKPMGQAALQRLTPLPEPAQTGTFDVLSTSHKLQILRIVMADDPAAAATLVPRCWTFGGEVAATAMIAAARLHLADQGLAVKRADLSAMPRTRREKEVFTALKKACLATLSGLTPTPANTPKNRFWRLVLGQVDPTEAPDDTSLLIHALTTPLPEATPTPAPEGFCTVPAIAHWIGHSRGRGLPNPLRRWTPDADFTIMTAANGHATRDTLVPALDTSSATTGHNLRLPTVTEWESAMRGPDARSYPWGVDPALPGLAMSPWGALWSGHPEWALSDGTPVLCGADPTGRVSYLKTANPGAQAYCRFVIEP